MKEFIRLFTYAFIAPFAIIWGAWLLTACSFDAKEAFNSALFWFFSIGWWVSAILIIGIHIEMEAKKKERAW
jgi:hypothetical protein